MPPDSYFAGGLATFFSPKALFVGGRVASLGILAKLRPTFEVPVFVRFQSLNGILIVHSM